jgi:DNA modification methylase
VTAVILRGDAAHLPLPDESVDLVVTSPPYFGQRDYRDGGESLEGQIGSEATPREYIDALLECTREWVRVLKPSGSIFVNLGDAYSARADGAAGRTWREDRAGALPPRRNTTGFTPRKSLMLLPQRYAIGCVDDLGLILRAEIIWDKPTAMPESVTDRVKRSHEHVFHLVRRERYFAAVDEIRQPLAAPGRKAGASAFGARNVSLPRASTGAYEGQNALGALPGSVWEIPSQPLIVPEALGLDHFAAFPMELPRRVILGWSPSGICTVCGGGRFPVADRTPMQWRESPTMSGRRGGRSLKPASGTMLAAAETRILGYACDCTPFTDHDGSGRPTTRRDYNPAPNGAHPQGTYGRKQAGEYERVGPWREYHLDGWTPPPARPAVVVDPFGGTGTTALVASVLGRAGITVDRSADYCRLAKWRTTDPGERARAMGVKKPPPVPDGQGSLFDSEAS